MSQIRDRRLLNQLQREFRSTLRLKTEIIEGVVVEVGSGGTAGMARVRRANLEPADVGRPFYKVVGAMPSTGNTVVAITNAFGGVIVTPGSGGSMTAADILTALLTVDGPGSNLDADTLDGFQGSAYVRSVNSVAPTSGNVVAEPNANKACQVSRTTDQSVAVDAWASVSWEAEDVDPSGWFTSSSPDLITPGEAGWYAVTLFTAWASNSTGVRRQGVSTVSNTGIDANLLTPGASNTNVSMTFTYIVYIDSSSDAIRCRIRQDGTGASLNLLSNVRARVVKLR